MEWIKAYLKKQKSAKLLRFLIPAAKREKGRIFINGKEYYDFSSNDYLGLSDHPKITRAAYQAAKKFGNSSSASRLLSGDLEIHHLLEEKIARLKGKKAALIFNSGYQANVGIFTALLGRGDVIFADKLCHASIIDGLQLSAAQLFRFHHNNISHLKMLLKKYRHKHKKSLIVTETVFSMDGDRAPVKEIVRLKEKHNCVLMVDEAHATGVFGLRGEGLAAGNKVDIIMGTFGKALGSFGAYIACSTALVNYFINKCRSFIYTTAPPPAIIAANLAAIKLLQAEPERRRTLLKNAKFFRNQLKAAGLETRGSSQIVPVIIGETKKTVTLSNKLIKAGYWVLPIRPPTVPKGEARLRFSLSYYHSQKLLKKLVDDIKCLS